MEDKPNILVFPPLAVLIALIATAVMGRVFSANTWPPFGDLTIFAIGGVVAALGFWLIFLAIRAFDRNGMYTDTSTSIEALVTDGPYRLTRNPMYLGMLLVQLGCAVTVGATTALGVPVLFGVIIEWRFIRPEEAMLRELFPVEFPAYCARVRRWI